MKYEKFIILSLVHLVVFQVTSAAQSGKATELERKIVIALNACNTGEARALDLVNEIIREASASGLKKQEASAHNIKGGIFCTDHRLKEGYEEFYKALQLRDHCKDSVGMTTVYRNVAWFKFKEGDYSSSIDTLKRAIQLNEGLCLRHKGTVRGDSALSNLGNDYLLLAEIYGNNFDPKEAVFTAKAAVLIFSELHSEREIARANFTLANQYYAYYLNSESESSPDSAQFYYEKALKFFLKDTTMLGNTARCYHNLGVIAVNKADFNTAIDYFNKSQKLYEVLYDKNGCWSSLIKLGWCYQNQQQYAKATPYFEEALQIDFSTFPTIEIRYFYEKLSEQFENLGKPDSALLFLQKAYELTDSLISEDVVRKTALLQKDFAQSNAEKEHLKAENNKLVAFGLAGFGVLLMIVLYLTFRFLKERAAKNLIKGRDDGREKTLRRVSEHLHTNVQMELRKVLKGLETVMPEHQEELKPIRSKLEQTNEMVRNLSHEWSIMEIKHSTLGDFMEELCDRIAEGTPEIQVCFDNQIAGKDVPFDLRLAVYRILMDLYVNTVKHASADVVAFSLAIENQTLRFRYWDNGIGFNFSEAIKLKNGIGLMEIVEKVELHNGQIESFTPEGGGSGFDIRMPLKKASNYLP